MLKKATKHDDVEMMTFAKESIAKLKEIDENVEAVDAEQEDIMVKGTYADDTLFVEITGMSEQEAQEFTMNYLTKTVLDFNKKLNEEQPIAQ